MKNLTPFFIQERRKQLGLVTVFLLLFFMAWKSPVNAAVETINISFDQCDTLVIDVNQDVCIVNRVVENRVSPILDTLDILELCVSIDLDNDGTIDFIGIHLPTSSCPNLPGGIPVLPLSYATTGVSLVEISLPALDWPVGVHRILWEIAGNGATDACEKIMVVNDHKQPTVLANHGLTVDLQPINCEVLVHANQMDAGSFDNCCLATNAFRLVHPSKGPNQTAPPADTTSSLLFNGCNSGTQTVDFWVQDCHGNWDYVQSYIHVQFNFCHPCPGALVGGLIKTAKDIPVSQVAVSATASFGGTNPGTVYTNMNGVYSFGPLEFNLDYTITPEKEEDDRNGISTLDVILIMRHLIGLNLLDNPYQYLAADVDNNGSINTFDVVAIQKIFLFIDMEWTNNSSWRFVDASYDFINPTNPWSSSFPEVVVINQLQENQQIDFVGIKTGDVSGSADNAAPPAEDRDLITPIALKIEDKKMLKGEEYLIPVKISDLQNRVLTGYQFALHLDPTFVEIVDLVPTDLAVAFGWSQKNKGTVTTSWASARAKNFDKEAVLFYVKVKAKQASSLKEIITLNSMKIAAEAYDGDLEILDLELIFSKEESTIAMVDELQVFQNQPNPFLEETLVTFQLPEAARTSFEIFDLAGKVVHSFMENYPRGSNQVKFNALNLSGAKGILFLKIKTAKATKVIKMIRL